MFLSKTKGTSRDIDKLKRKWNLNGIVVDRVGLAGGLAMLWRKETQIQLLSLSRYYSFSA